MYTMTCDGHPLLDARDDDYILGSPRIKSEVNTVGEGSFRIYFNHPNIDKLMPLLSVFEVKDEYGTIFRGRMTEDTKDFDNCKDVDLEGAMSYFNDSVVRPYAFPEDFAEDAEYQAAAAETPEQAAIDGGVVRFLLKWYIERHNEQVEEFQQFKLGNVTVYDKNNYLKLSASDYPSTWKEIERKLFNSSLGGFLCIRYEEDGNYIDYLREFTEVNEQGITYGENMLDISQNTYANETYSAIIPLGKEGETTETSGEVQEGLYVDFVGGSTSTRRLTIDTDSLPDGNITDDIVKKGDTLYSKKAVAAYGWRYAPRDVTTWDDVTEPANLQSKGVAFLEGEATKIPSTFKVSAVDLNCTDSQIRSFRIYAKIPVYTLPHGVYDNFDLTVLDIDLLNPQNTKITVGKTVTTLTKNQTTQLKRVLSSYAPNAQVAEGFKKTEKLVEETEASITTTISGTYATKDELRETAASLAITDEYIEAVVSGKYATIDSLGNYATVKTVDNKISVALDGINLSVYATKEQLGDYATTEYVDGSLALKIVEDEDGIRYSQLAADVDKIVFNTGEIEINSDFFSLTADGHITASGITITGGDIKIPLAAWSDAYATINSSGIGCSDIDSGGSELLLYPEHIYFGTSSGGIRKIIFDSYTHDGLLNGAWYAFPTVEGASKTQSSIVTMADLEALGLI